MANVFFGPGGQAIATFLHTVGAIGYLAGIAFFIGWKRSLHRGHHNASVLATGAALAYVSIAANLLGGFMRTYAPGHPGLTAILDEPWVMVMAIKHVALFAGIGAAAWLFEIVAPRLKARFDAGDLGDGSERSGRWAARAVVLSIVLAGVLGGASAVIPVGEGDANGDGAAGTAPPEPFTGSRLAFNGGATSGSPDSGTFAVPDAARGIEAVLTVGDVAGALPAPFQATLTLTDPIGAQHSDATPRTGQRSATVDIDAPLPGAWTYQVSTDAGVEVSWSLAIDVVGQALVEGEVTVLAGGSFAIDLAAAAGSDLHWDWSADAELAWDIHAHDDMQPLAGGTSAVEAGSLPIQRGGDHSYHWEAARETVLSYRVWGDFEVVSVG